MMRIIVVHNFYQQPGGEDQVFQDEVRLLARFGHEVQTFAVHNDRLKDQKSWSQFRTTFWNRELVRDLAEKVATHRAEVVHFHNTFPLLSPGAYYAAGQNGAAVVQTLHNYRLICPGALLYRDKSPCERCVGSWLSLPGVVHGCYRKSRAVTAVTAGMLAFHRIIRTWKNRVDLYLALSEFGRQRFIRGGLPEDRIVVKPNFLANDPGVGHGEGNFALFVGRLTEDKGIETLLQAWPMVKHGLKLKIAGDGPLSETVKASARNDARIEWLGRQPVSRVMELMQEATCLIFPSRWYEGHPRTIVESLACGTPVIASRIGAIPESLPERHDLFFEPGNPFQLAAVVNRYLSRNECAWYRATARETFLRRYTDQIGYQNLERVYHQALGIRTERTKTTHRIIPSEGQSSPVQQ